MLLNERIARALVLLVFGEEGMPLVKESLGEVVFETEGGSYIVKAPSDHYLVLFRTENYETAFKVIVREAYRRTTTRYYPEFFEPE